MLNQVSSRVSSFRGRAAEAALERYREGVIEVANRRHVAGHLVPLSDVAVAPRFFNLRPPFNPLDTDIVDLNPLSLVPLTTDFPQAFAPYELPGLSLKGLLQSGKQIAILGSPGSGKSVTLSLIALQAAQQFVSSDSDDLFFEPHLPILAELGNFDFGALAFDQEHSVLAPLFNAASVELKNTSGRQWDMAQNACALGHAVILLDGWSGLSVQQQAEVTDWLAVFIEHYPRVTTVLTGPSQGYQRLQAAGFLPLFMMPWGRVAREQMVQRWRTAWPLIGGQPEDPAPIPDNAAVKRAEGALHGRNALDSVLKVWATFAGAERTARQIDWYDAYWERVTPAPYLVGALQQFARNLLLDDGKQNTYQQLLSLVDAEQHKGAGLQSVRTPDYLYSLLNESRILQQFSDGRVAFRNQNVGAYLASKDIEAGEFLPNLLEQNDDLILAFVAQQQDMEPYVAQQLEAPATLLGDSVLRIARWMPDTPIDTPWRKEVFKLYARMFLAGGAFPLVRERTMAALVSTLDVNTAFIFERGLQDDDPQVRLLSALGLGALGDSENVVLIGQALSDSDGGVQVAAGLALGAIGNKAALTYMLQTFVTGDEMARRGIAEMLSTNINGEGHDILKEALDEPDPLTRKAAIYALERVDAPWVLEQLENSERHDGQFIIRSAATDILERLRSGQVNTVEKTPYPAGLEWVNQYYQRQNQEVQRGRAGIFKVIDILASGNEVQQLAAAETLGTLGEADAVAPLYEALTIQHPEIRDSVYRALGSISHKLGVQLPAVI